ncbi:MAG: Gldg family protein [Gloeobacteraceae cyanobacterium ES-bin-144]|nr:Gldg family protein [Verrucomicrobiales bacterium]
MSDSNKEPTKLPVRPLNRWGIGTFAVLQIALLGVIVLALNYLSANHYERLDLSRESNYTLSPSTKRYLKSPAVSNREKPIKWIISYRRTSPFYERARAMAEEYVRISKGKIQLEIVDPLRSPDRMQEVVAGYGLTLVRDFMIIDARTDDSAVTIEDATKTRTLNPHVKLVVAEELAVYTSSEGKRKITGFQGEDVLTSRLVESLEGKPRKMALIADKSHTDSKSGPSLRQSLEENLRFQNVELSEIQLSGLNEIPEDVTGIILAAPKYDLTDDEIAVIEKYWSRTRAAILVLIDSGVTPPKLRALLRSNGVTPRSDRVISRGDDGIVTSASGFFTKGIEFTGDLAGQTTEFGGASSSLDIREGANDLINRRIFPMGLVQVRDGFWGETKFGQGNEKFDEREDNKLPLYLAACVILGAESDDRFAADTSRMIIISNTDFLNPLNHRAENLDFFASSVNWLVGRSSLAGVGPRSLGTYKLPLLDAQVSFINRMNLFFLPAFLLLIGGFVWSSRRA